MSSIRILSIALALFLIVIAGCSSGGGFLPVAPGTDGTNYQDPVYPRQPVNETSQTALLGLWYLQYDFNTEQFVIAPNRTSDMTINVNHFLNQGNNLQVTIVDNSELMSDGKLTVDVGLTHPFTNMTNMSGFDVRGIFLHNGSANLDYGTGLSYGVPGEDGVLLNADGYTRWWNRSEFPVPGNFGYTPGASGNLQNPTAKLNGYKYFADELLTVGEVGKFLDKPEVINRRGAFLSGSTNFRRYELQFPMSFGSPDVQFQYAVTASWAQPTKVGNSFNIQGADGKWKFQDAAVSEEAIHLDVIDSSILFFDGENGGGEISFDLEVFDWGALAGDIKTEIGSIQIECPLLDAPYILDHNDVVTLAQPGAGFSSTYSFDFEVAPPTNNDPVDVWIIVEQAEGTYQNQFNITAPNAPLASYARLWIDVGHEGFTPPVIESGVNGFPPFCDDGKTEYNVEASGQITEYRWSVELQGSPKVFDKVGGNTLEVDWSLLPEDMIYEIDCRVFNGPIYTLADTLIIDLPPDSPPGVLYGVSGPTASLPDGVSQYKTVGYDGGETTLFTDDFSANHGWYFTGNWNIVDGEMEAAPDGIYGVNSYAELAGVFIPDGAYAATINYTSTLDVEDENCTNDVARVMINQGQGWQNALAIGSVDAPGLTCWDSWGASYPTANSHWVLPDLGGKTISIRFYLATDNTANNHGNWVIDNFKVGWFENCGQLDYRWSVVPSGNQPVYDIDTPETLNVDWADYGVGAWDVGCRIWDDLLFVDADILTVDVDSGDCAGGNYADDLGSGSFELSVVPRLDIAFLYGGEHAGECLVNGNYMYTGNYYNNAQDGLYYFDADSPTVSAPSLLFEPYDSWWEAPLGTALKFAVDEHTHNYIAMNNAAWSERVHVFDQDGTQIYASGTSPEWHYSPIVGMTWDDGGNLWLVNVCTTGEINDMPWLDRVKLKWLQWNGSSFNFEQYDGTDSLDITDITGFGIKNESDIFDIEYIATLNEIWVFEGGADGRGSVHRFTANLEDVHYIDSITSIFSDTIDIMHFPQTIQWTNPLFVSGADITVDRAAPGVDICHIIIFANLTSGGAEIRKYDNGQFVDPQFTEDQYAACAINNDPDIAKHNLTFVNQGSSTEFTVWAPPADW